MGSGKTTHGRILAKKLGYDFIDLDTYITEKEGKSIPAIFDGAGEEYFRKKETESLRELEKEEQVVISTGGGAPCHSGNMERMKKSGLTVYLKLSPSALLSRLKRSRTDRPLLAGKTESEMFRTIQELLTSREVYYEQADRIIDGLTNVDQRLLQATLSST